MSRELLQQALKAFEAIMVEIDAESCRIIAKNARYGLREELAKPEQEEPLSPVDIGVDVTPEGTHVVACYNRPDAVQEMFYSQFHPLAKPEQEPVAWAAKSVWGDLEGLSFDKQPRFDIPLYALEVMK